MEKVIEDAINNLVKFPALSNQEKADVLLVYKKAKPVAAVELNPYSLKAVLVFKKILENLRLIYKINRNIKEYPSFYIARNVTRVRQLINAFRERDIKKRRVKIGKILGYPRTAVRAFAMNQWKDPKTLSKSIIKAEWLQFLNFRLSNENWKRELTFVKRRAKLIQKYFPVLYAKVLSDVSKKYKRCYGK